jgi:hypothetical protein
MLRRLMETPRLLWLLAFLSLGACAAAPPPEIPVADRRDVAALGHAIRALGDGVDPEEAERAARIAFSHSRHLAREYRVTDPPLVHNAKVHLGLRPRGLCYHWAEDMETRLLEEEFRTLDLHRAIAPETLFRIEHSTAVISRKGDSLSEGVVLDPWREGGRLHWTPVRADTGYDWRPQVEVLDQRWQAKLGQQQLSTISP